MCRKEKKCFNSTFKKLEKRVYFPKSYLLSDHKFRNQILNTVGSFLHLKQIFDVCSPAGQIRDYLRKASILEPCDHTLPRTWHMLQVTWHQKRRSFGAKLGWGLDRWGSRSRRQGTEWGRGLYHALPCDRGSGTHCSAAHLPRHKARCLD